MSTNWPAVSKRPSISRRFMPLSITWVRPSVRGLPGRCGRSRKPSLKAGIQLLQLLLRGFLDVVVERVAVGVDADRQRAEVAYAELPDAFGHQLLPVHLLDLLDLRRLERRRAADDREVDDPVPPHRLDRLVGKAALAADRPDAIAGAERLGEAHHPRRRRGADAERIVAAVLALADVRRRMEQERSAQVERRFHALGEDADLGPIADADHVTLDDDFVAGAQLQDLALVSDREGDLVLRHAQSGLVRGRTPAIARRDVL